MACQTFVLDDKAHGVTAPFPSIGALGSKTGWTVNFWMYPTHNCKGLVVGQVVSEFQSIRISLSDDKRLCFTYQSDPNEILHCCSSKERVPSSRWTWVACSFSKGENGGGGRVRLSLNGNFQAECTMQEDVLRLGKHPFQIGGWINKKNPEKSVTGFQGLISGLRIDECCNMKSSFDRKPLFPQEFREPLLYETAPIRSLQEFALWEPGSDPMNVSYVPLRQRIEDDGKIQAIHCHDMAGGYGQDWNVQGQFSNSPVERPGSNPFKLNSYNFFNWELVDTFIYFSHARVAIPPPGWTDAAHKNGAKILATFITEFGGGAPDNYVLLDGPNGENEGKEEPSYFFADKFIEMARYYGFDGWFFNIESDLDGPVYVNKMLLFLRYLKARMQEQLPGSLVCWYDSVIATTGQVRWQNILNDLNKPFFDESDSIFCNYGWRQDYPRRSAEASQGRPTDVYMGIDIWGRGTYGGGGFNTYIALDAIVQAGTSAALFAPAWTYEPTSSAADRTAFERNEARLWLGQITSKEKGVKEDQVESKHEATDSHNSQTKKNTGVNSYIESAQHSLSVLPFVSHINQAIGQHMFIGGESVMRNNQWFHMAQQDPQPSYEIRSSIANMFTSSITYETAFDGGASVKVVAQPQSQPRSNGGKQNRLQTAEFQLFRFSGNVQSDVIVDYAVLSRDSADCDLAVILETTDGKTQLGGRQRSDNADRFILPSSTDTINGWEKRQFVVPRTNITNALLFSSTESSLSQPCSMYFGRFVIVEEGFQVNPRSVTNLSYEPSFNIESISSGREIYTLNFRWETQDENVSHFDIYRDDVWIGRAVSPYFVAYEEDIDDTYDHSFGVRPVSLAGVSQDLGDITRIRITQIK